MASPLIATLSLIRPADWKKVIAAVIIGFYLFSIFDQSSFLFHILNLLGRYFEGEQVIMSEEISRRTFVVTTTYYPDISDIRFHLALELCRLAHLHKIHLIIVDDSPEHESVRDHFQQAGTPEYVHTFQQDKTNYSGKGGALRQAIQGAANLIEKSKTERGNALNDAVICFIEPEKSI
mmetsp:Transcript_25356/g.54532  ORF Transcript_25356/g.54532 Transcript_25356/m.54532 type:complete len:178 (+) Transcript_25356:194-727(+)